MKEKGVTSPGADRLAECPKPSPEWNADDNVGICY